MSETERRERLGAYLDGEMDAEARRALEKELEQDAELRQELERLRRTSTELRSFYGQEVESAVDAQGEAIAHERIVRMSTTALRRGDIERPKRRSFLMIGAVLVMVAGLGILVASPWISGEPTAEELIENARDELGSAYLQFDLESAFLRPGELSLVGMGWEAPPRFRYRRGPGGLFHFHLAMEDAWQEHLGRDADGDWIKPATEERVLRLGDERDGRSETLFKLIENLEIGLRTSLDVARAHPSALDLVGRVRDAEENELWKVQLGGALVDQRASFWFDDERRLARIKVGIFDLEVDRSVKLGPKDLDPVTILPDLPIEDLRE